jgi:hypothetical protein
MIEINLIKDFLVFTREILWTHVIMQALFLGFLLVIVIELFMTRRTLTKLVEKKPITPVIEVKSDSDLIKSIVKEANRCHPRLSEKLK